MSITKPHDMITKSQTKTKIISKKNTPDTSPFVQPELNSQVVKKSTKSSKTVRKIKSTIKSFFKISKQNSVLDRARVKFTEENQALLDICNHDKNLAYVNEEFLRVIDALEKYAKSATDDDESFNTANAINIISEYIRFNPSPTNDKELELLERVKSYSYFLEMKTDGSLSGYEHEKGEKVENPDAGTLNIWKDVSSQKLFSHEPSVNDIQQRRTEDCYMLSSLSSIALSSPHLIKQALKDNGDGTVTVRFFDNQEKEFFYTDKTFKELSLEENSDLKLLTKLGSMLQSKEGTVSKHIGDYIDAKNKELEKQSNENTQDDNSDFTEDELADFLMEDLKTTTAPTVNAKTDTILNILNSNNLSWYNELFSKCLNSSNSELKMCFTKIADMLKADSIDEKEIITSFFDTLINSEILNDFAVLQKDMVSEKQEYKKVYVTVSKEISTIGGVIEKHAANSLWVQMIEKAYASKFGGDKGYKGIALNQSSVFLNRFLNKPYTNDEIAPLKVKSITDGNDTLILEKQLKEIFNEARNLSKDKNLNIENVIKIIFSKPDFAKYEDNDKKKLIKLITDQLEAQNIMHKEFSGLYSPAAEEIFDTISTNLKSKNIITVGVNKNSSLKKEREDALNSSGIRVGHAYALLDAFESEGHKFVTLRDPYGLFRREYEKTEFTDGQFEITKKNASKISLNATDTMGAFNMEFNDFLATFDSYSGILK